jgi:hypothetical protein
MGTEMDAMETVACSTKVSKFKLKQVYATKNTSMHPEHLKV